jgi:ATP-binding cassette subfamily B protein
MMEDVASEDRKSTQPRPRQGLHAWLRPLRKVWLAMRHRQISQQEESMSEIGIRLTYDLKDTLTANPFVSLWRMTTGFRAIYLVAIVAAGLAALSSSAVFYLLRYFVDDVLPGSDRRGDLPWVAAGIIGLALLQGLFTFGMGRSAAQTAEGVARRLRNYLYDQIQRLTFTYHDNMQTGELIQRATSDVDTLRRLFQDQLIGIGRIGLLLVVNLSALVLLHGWLALLSIPVFPIVSVASYIFFKRVGTLFESYQSQDAVVSNRLQETLSGVRVVKAFARQSFEIERFDEENWEKYRRGVRIANLHTLFWPFIEVLTGGQILFGMYMASMMALRDEISLGTYVAFTGLLMATVWPVQGIGRLLAHVSSGLVSLNRVQEIIRQEREQLEEGSAPTNKRLRGALQFRNVQFAYERPAAKEGGEAKKGKEGNQDRQETRRRAFAERGYVLRDISFDVEPGQVIGLLGATGSGKSSLVNLLPRFYDYSGGNISLDGEELRAYARGFLRGQIGIVQQEPFLFSTTIRNNITYGLGRDVPDEEMEAAARAAAVHDVIQTFPKGYDTLVGERGVTLSGGQKQRVTIARTLLKDPAILLLDDATSSVDTETDATIRAALRHLMQGRTTFIIAHRVQSVMAADLILVMEAGRIIQRGSHDELVSQPGVYRQIFELQVQIEADLEREIAEVVEAAEVKLDGFEEGQRTPDEDGAPSAPEIPHSVSKG